MVQAMCGTDSRLGLSRFRAPELRFVALDDGRKASEMPDSVRGRQSHSAKVYSAQGWPAPTYAVHRRCSEVAAIWLPLCAARLLGAHHGMKAPRAFKTARQPFQHPVCNTATDDSKKFLDPMPRENRRCPAAGGLIKAVPGRVGRGGPGALTYSAVAEPGSLGLDGERARKGDVPRNDPCGMRAVSGSMRADRKT